MGKKRITELLEQLEANQQKELHNAAAIYTVAQVAVNELREHELQIPQPSVGVLPSAPPKIDKAELIRQYGSYNACRQAAKKQGIKFSRTPSWEQLAAAFNYAQAFREVIQAYVEMYPTSELKGTKFELSLEGG